MFKASKRQESIFNLWNTTENNLLINAVAGSGKTTTLLQLLGMCKHRTLFLAFNTSVQREIQEKIEAKGLRQGKAKTIHSLGLSAIRNWKRYKVNKGKNFDLIKILQAQNKKYFNWMDWGTKLRLTYTLMDMNDISRLFLTDDMEEIINYGLGAGKSLYVCPDLKNLWENFKEIRDKSYEKKVVDIDFNDMIYLPVVKNLEIPIYPTYLMIDEAQDLNLCQHALIDKIIAQDTLKKWIAVGDRNQAIYGFSGAYSNSFDLFIQKDKVVECPLDICYRCDTDIIAVANEVYDVMQPFREEPGVVKYANDAYEIKPRAMVICRNTNPIIDLYFQLITAGRSCYIEGEEILNSVVRFLKPHNNLQIMFATDVMRSKLDELSRDQSDRGMMMFNIYNQNFQNYLRLVRGLYYTGREPVSKLATEIKKLFVGKKDSIKLCTIHKAKGLEADIVYILNEGLIPSKFATTDEQLKQEQNLKYVARTRAKHELYFLNL